MDQVRERPAIALAVAFIVGFIIGLVGFGWGLTPLEFTDAGPQDMLPEQQETYLRSLADLYSFDGNQARVREALAIWPEADQAACQMAAQTLDPAEASRLTALAAVLNGAGCDATVVGPIGEVEEEEGGGFLLICGLALLLLLILGAIYWVWQRQTQPLDTMARRYDVEDMEGEAPAIESTSAGAETVPVARFRTTYSRGHDTYDDSFSIENSASEFLGECGVGISESIGVEGPKNVTAFEVWLFDKNDIRTVTKVVMSDHAFFDEALKAKLAPKGEPVLAREGETVVLETASLIINARLTDLVYGESGELPSQSFFDNFTVELSAWAKDGDFQGPDIAGRVDELMNY
jgi:hypothetical protein